MIDITDALARVILDSGVDVVFNSGKMQFRSGAAPGPAAAPTGTLLAEITLPADAFAAASGRSKGKNGTWSANGVAAGTIGYFRMITSADTGAATDEESRAEGGVGVQGATINISSITQPDDDRYEVTSASAHGLALSQEVEIAGHSAGDFNVRWTVVEIPTATTFRILGNVGAPGTGGTIRPSFDCTVDNTSIGVGQLITVNAFSWRM